MNYIQIEAFLTIVKMGSLNKAAEMLYISQPSLTYRLKSLEDELGHRLFARKKGQHITRLTPEGRIFLPIAEQWKSAWLETESFKMNKSLKEIRISSVDSLNTFVFDSLYRSLGGMLNHLSIQTHHSLEIYNLVSKGDIDVGFSLQHFSFPDIDVVPIFSEKMYLVFGPESTICDQPMHPLKLNPSNEVYLNWGYEFRNWHDFWFGKASQPYAKIDTIPLMEQFLHRDNWAIVPSSVLAVFQEKGSYHTISFEQPPPDRICYMITSCKSMQKNMKWAADFFETLNDFLQHMICLDRLWYN